MRMIIVYNVTGNVLRVTIYDSNNSRILDEGSSLGYSTDEIEFKLTQKNLKKYMKDHNMVNLKNIEKDNI